MWEQDRFTKRIKPSLMTPEEFAEYKELEDKSKFTRGLMKTAHYMKRFFNNSEEKRNDIMNEKIW